MPDDASAALLSLAGLMMMWLSMSAVLMGAMLVLPDVTPALPRRPRAMMVCQFLRGDQGLWGTSRIGLALGAALWWYCAAGFPLPEGTQEGGALLIGNLVLIAMFNAARRLSLPPWRQVALCAGLGAGWVVMLAVALEVAVAWC